MGKNNLILEPKRDLYYRKSAFDYQNNWYIKMSQEENIYH